MASTSSGVNIGENPGVLSNRCNTLRFPSPVRFSSKLREMNQTYDLENSEHFTNIKPRTIVDDFKKKHVARNCQKKVPAYRNDLSLYQFVLGLSLM
jgi:hypothetical protein